MNISRGAFVVTALIFIAFGIVLIAFPVFAAATFAVMVGVSLLFVAISAFLTWFNLHATVGGSNVPVFSIILLVMAIVCLVHPLGLAATIGWIIALCVTISGIVQLVDAARGPLHGFDMVVAIIISAIVTLFGIAALAFPAMLIVYMGISLVVEGFYLLFAAARLRTIVDVNSY